MKRGPVKKTKKKVKESKIKTFLNNKKLLAVVISAFFIVTFLFGFVSIRNKTITGQVSLIDGIGQVTDSVGQILESIFIFLLGDVGEGLLFSKIIFFIIIIGIIWLALNTIDFFNKKPIILNIITFAVSVLAIRGISSTDLIDTILLPYTALGIALSAGIPFVIYFIIINVGFQDQPPIIRRLAWVFFGVIFLGLWFSRSDLGDFDYIYLGTAILAIIMAFMDGTIKGFFAKIQADKIRNIKTTEIVVSLKKKINDVKEGVKDEYISESDGNVLIKNYQRKIRYFMK